MTTPTKVYVVARFHGYEGYSAPHQAFLVEAEARNFLKVIKGVTDETFHLFEVPLFPTLSDVTWFNIEPLKDPK